MIKLTVSEIFYDSKERKLILFFVLFINFYLVAEHLPHNADLVTIDSTVLAASASGIGNITSKLQQVLTADVLPKCSSSFTNGVPIQVF